MTPSLLSCHRLPSLPSGPYPLTFAASVSLLPTPPPPLRLIVMYFCHQQSSCRLHCRPPPNCNPSARRAKGTCNCHQQRTCPDAHVRTPAEGCWRYYSPGGRSFPLRLIAGEDDMLAESEKYHDQLFLWVCMLVCRQEGIAKKLANVRAVPGGGGMI